MIKVALALAMLAGAPAATFALDKKNTGGAPNADWELVYEHKIPKQAGKNDEGGSGWVTRDDIPYRQDLCDTFANTPFGKVGYEFILDDTTAWAEFNTPENMDACKTGLPADWTFDLPITGLTVRVEKDDGTFNTPALGITGGTGSIEFWSHCYGVGVDGTWDYDDYPRNDRVDCYGSMQIHHSTGTVLSYNAWSGGTSQKRVIDLGIGNCPAGDSRWSLCHPDWTFAQNSKKFKVRYLNIYVKTGIGSPSLTPTFEPTMQPSYQFPCGDTKFQVVTNDGSCVSIDSLGAGVQSAAVSCADGQVQDMITNPPTCLNLCSAMPLDANCVDVEGDGCAALIEITVQLQTVISGFASVEAFDASAQTILKKVVVAASSLVESTDVINIIAVSEIFRRRALLDMSLDVDYTVTVSVEDETVGATQLVDDINANANFVNANGPGIYNTNANSPAFYVLTTLEGTTSSGGGGGGGTGAICFSGDSSLTLEDGSKKTFKNLEVGDVILSADRAGNISPSKVLFLPHKLNTVRRNFDEVETKRGKKIKMTTHHLVPLCDGSLVTARSLEAGDCLMTTDGSDVVSKTVADIEGNGIYTAVTENEFLVVDGIVASPFALAHGVAHSLFNRTDVTEWCEDNSHLLEHTADEEIKEIVGRRRLTEASNGCVELMKTLFENYRDEGVGWGNSGWGYRTFKTLRGAAEEAPTSLQMRLSGWA